MDLEVLAAFVHGTVTFGNVLGAVYNFRRRNWRWCAIHVVGAALHITATIDHARDARHVQQTRPEAP